MKKCFLLTLFAFFLGIVSHFAQAPLQTVVQRGHEKPVSCAVFSPDGKYIATGSLDNSIKLWSVDSKHEIRTFHSHTDKIFDLAFSPKGDKIASIGKDNRLLVHDIVSGQLVNQFTDEKSTFSEVIFSPDGNYLISFNQQHYVMVWDLVSNKLFKTLERSYSGRLTKQSVASTNFLLPHVAKSDQLLVLNVLNGDTISNVELSNYYNSVFSPDGKFLAIGSDKLQTEILDLQKNKITDVLISDPENQCWGCKTKVAYSNNSLMLLSGSSKNGVTLWDMPKGKNRYTVNAEKGVNFIEFSSDDQYFFINADDVVIVYETATGKEVYRMEDEFLDYFTPHFAPKSHQILIPGLFNSVEIYDLDKAKIIAQFKGYLNQDKNDGMDLYYTNWIDDKVLKNVSMKTEIALSPDGKYIVKGNVDSSVFVIELASGRMVKKLSGHNKMVYRIKYSHDGKYLATGGGDRYIIIWNTETWQEVARLKGHVEIVFDFAFSPDDKELLSAAWDAYLIHWDLETYTPKSWLNLEKSSVYSLAYTPDKLYEIVGDLSHNIQCLEGDTKENFRNLIGHSSLLSEAIFTNDHELVTASWDGSVKVWDFNSGRIKYKQKAHQGAVLSLVYNPEKSEVISGGADGKLIFWNYQNNQFTDTIKAHNNALTSIKISADNRFLVTSSADGEVKVWDLKKREELYTYMQINSEDWLVTNPHGYFDGTANAQKLVNYVKGLEVVPISTMFKKYFTPNLSKRIMSGEKFSYNEEDFENQLKSIPKLEINFNQKENYLVETDSITFSKTDYVYADLSIHSDFPSNFTTHVFKNGKLVKNFSLVRGKDVKESHLPIHLSNGKNTLEFVVENEFGIESEKVKRVFYFDGEKGKTDLFVLAIGINDYQKTEYNLNYAVNDAQSFVDQMKSGADSLFARKVVYSLKNANATKEELEKKIKQIEQEIGPEDVFVFFYAGHGVMTPQTESMAQRFFLIMHDVTNMYASATDLASKAFSAEEISAISTQLVAEKQLYILDACQSGGALQAFATRGFDREKALAQLARSTGTFFLTASQDFQFANESNELKHGMFTYSILEALSGKDETSKLDKKITVNELKTYVEERVPELSKEYKTYVQYPTSYGFGQDFPLVIFTK